jgi:hypothetical protein
VTPSGCGGVTDATMPGPFFQMVAAVVFIATLAESFTPSPLFPPANALVSPSMILFKPRMVSNRICKPSTGGLFLNHLLQALPKVTKTPRVRKIATNATQSSQSDILYTIIMAILDVVLIVQCFYLLVVAPWISKEVQVPLTHVHSTIFWCEPNCMFFHFCDFLLRSLLISGTEDQGRNNSRNQGRSKKPQSTCLYYDHDNEASKCVVRQ